MKKLEITFEQRNRQLHLIDILRSKKYKQIRGGTNDGMNGRCFVGVIRSEFNEINWSGDQINEFMGFPKYPTWSLWAWVFGGKVYKVTIFQKRFFFFKKRSNAIALNDIWGWSFLKFADHIENFFCIKEEPKGNTTVDQILSKPNIVEQTMKINQN